MHRLLEWRAFSNTVHQLKQQLLSSNPEERKGYVKQMITIGAFFFIFGFLTWVNGTLIPYLRIACELEEWQGYLVTFSFYIAYTVMAIPSSKLLQRTGMIGGMRVGLLIMAAGCGLFIPAALTRYYPFFLLALFIVGSGLTLLQTAVNPYITLLGPVSSAAKRISIMGICNKLAGVVAPLILGAIILNHADSLLQELKSLAAPERILRLDSLAHAVILPYGILALVLMLVAFAIQFAQLPEIEPAASVKTASVESPSKSYALPAGFIAIFCTVGVEVIAGDTISNYGLYRGLGLDMAKHLTSFTLAGMFAGYLFGSLAIPRIISQEKAFKYSCFLGLAITILILFTSGLFSVMCVALLGIANALLWPAIWPQALNGLKGAALNRASAILIMGIAGGALLPLLYGWLAKSMNNQMAYGLLIPCYLFDLYYYRMGRQQKNYYQ